LERSGNTLLYNEDKKLNYFSLLEDKNYIQGGLHQYNEFNKEKLANSITYDSVNGFKLVYDPYLGDEPIVSVKIEMGPHPCLLDDSNTRL